MSEREKLVEAMMNAYVSVAGSLVGMSAALTVAEAAFERRERHEPRGCPTPGACSCTRAAAAIETPAITGISLSADEGTILVQVELGGRWHDVIEAPNEGAIVRVVRAREIVRFGSSNEDAP